MSDYDPILGPIAVLNPVPSEDDLPIGAADAAELLNRIERRKSGSDARNSRIEQVPQRRWGPAWAAVAAFAAVILIALVPVVLGVFGGGDDAAETPTPSSTTVAPTTTSTPTTTTTTIATTTTTLPQLRPTDPAALAYLEEIVADLNSGEPISAAAGLLGAETFIGPVNEFDDRLLVANWFELWVALESDVALDECRTASSGVTRCVVSHTSMLQPFHPDREKVIFEFTLAEGAVDFMRVQRDQTSSAFSIWLGFTDWLWDRDTDAHDEIFFVVDPAAAAEILKEQVPIWRDEQGR